MFGVSLSFRRDEIGVRKTVPIPRYASLLDSQGQPTTLRFKAQELAPDDVIEIDVDGIRVSEESGLNTPSTECTEVGKPANSPYLGRVTLP